MFMIKIFHIFIFGALVAYFALTQLHAGHHHHSEESNCICIKDLISSQSGYLLSDLESECLTCDLIKSTKNGFYFKKSEDLLSLNEQILSFIIFYKGYFKSQLSHLKFPRAPPSLV